MMLELNDIEIWFIYPLVSQVGYVTVGNNICLGSMFFPFLDIDAVWAFLILNFECQISEIHCFMYIVEVLPITVLTSDRVLGSTKLHLSCCLFSSTSCTF